MARAYRLFAINPGSTSTKVALYENDREVFSVNVTHDAARLATFAEISDQLPYRRETILAELEKRGLSLAGVDAFIGRGGGLVGCEGGTYEINEALLHHARIGFTVKHPATLGSQLAAEFAAQVGARAFVVNPPDVDEMEEVARVCGLAGAARESRGHPLNQKEVAIRHAASVGKRYEEMNLVVSHIGGGVSVTAHRKGRMVDTTDVVNGDGPFAPTRAGAVPGAAVVGMCFSEGMTKKRMMDYFTKNGGMVDHLGTADALEVKARIQAGDAYAKLVYDAMAYQIGKSIGAYAAVLKGDVDAILLTGGIARDTDLVAAIRDMVGFIAPVVAYPGEFEMEAMASGALRVLTGEEKPKAYTGVPVWSGFARK
jgi:butyrate kinase